MEALGAMRYDRGVQALTDLFTYHGKGDVAEAALDALARIAHPASVPLFNAQLGASRAAARHRHRRAGARRRRLAAAGRSSGARQGARAERDPRRRHSRSSLLATNRRPASPTRCGRPRLRDQAKRYLVEIAPGRTAPSHASSLDPDPQMRADVIDMLGLAGDRAALPIVEPLLAGSGSAGRPRGRARPGAAPCRAGVKLSARVLRSPDPRRRARSARQGSRARPARRAHERRDRRSRGLHRRSSIRPAMRPRDRPQRNAPLYGRARSRLRLSQLRHPLSGERGHRVARIAGRGADPRAGSARRDRRDAPRVAVGLRRAGRRRGTKPIAAARSLPRTGQPDDGDGHHAGREPARSARRSLFIEDRGIEPGAIVWGPRIGIRVGIEAPWRAWIAAHPAVSAPPASRGALGAGLLPRVEPGR